MRVPAIVFPLTFPRAFSAALLAPVVILSGVTFTGPALADDGACSRVAGQTWIAAEVAVEKVQALGYVIREIKRDKGCWKVQGFDRNGAKIKLNLEASSGEVIRSRN